MRKVQGEVAPRSRQNIELSQTMTCASILFNPCVIRTMPVLCILELQGGGTMERILAKATQTPQQIEHR